jgi:ketosteroid isomerase-like protein
MRKLIFILATLAVAAAVPARASDQSDIMATVHQFFDSVDKGDAKSAFAACSSPMVIIDEFPPHVWQGATACQDWLHDLTAINAKFGMSKPNAQVGTARRIDVNGDRAYVVADSTYAFEQKGKTTTETGSTVVLALKKTPSGWRLTGWAWSTK